MFLVVKEMVVMEEQLKFEKQRVLLGKLVQKHKIEVGR